MTSAERLKAALSDANPAVCLRQTVEQLLTEGCAQEEIVNLLERLLVDVRGKDARETDKEAILDVLDGMAGWCHEERRLVPKGD